MKIVGVLHFRIKMREIVKKLCSNTNNQFPHLFFTGIINDNQNWKNNRKLTLHALRDFGFGKKSLDERVYEEAEQFCNYLSTMEGQVVDIKIHAMKAFSNIICTIVFGDR